MKIDREKIGGRSGCEQNECLLLARRLNQCSDDILISELRKIKYWNYGKCELGLWADVLDRMDSILEYAATQVGSWTLRVDLVENESLVSDVVTILEFTGHLIEHSIYRYLYGSWNHILTLFGSSNMDILLAVLGVSYTFSKRSNYFTRLDKNHRKLIMDRLVSIAEFPESAGNIHFEYIPESKPGMDPGSLTSDVAPSNMREVVLKSLHKSNQNPSKIMEDILKDHSIPSNKMISIFSRIRLAVYFADPEQRQKCIRARLQALSILSYTFEVDQRNFYPNLLDELIEILHLPFHQYTGIKACALRTLTAIANSHRLGPNLETLIRSTGLPSYYGILPTLTRRWIQDLIQGEIDAPTGSINQHFTTALLSFLFHLACYGEDGNSSSRNSTLLVHNGTFKSMLRLISWQTPKIDALSYVTRAVRVTEQLLTTSFPSNERESVMCALVDRLEYEVDYLIVQSASASAPPTKMSSQRSGLLKSLINLIKRLCPDSIWADVAHTLMEKRLPNLLRRIYNNPDVFVPHLALGSIEVMTNYIYAYPSRLSTMQDTNVTSSILNALTSRPLPANREFLTRLPGVLNTFALNSAGVKAVSSSGILGQLLHTLVDPAYLSVMTNQRLLRDPTALPAGSNQASALFAPPLPPPPSSINDDSTFSADGRPTLFTSSMTQGFITSSQMSASTQELLRAHSELKPVVFQGLIDCLKRIIELGNSRPAKLDQDDTTAASGQVSEPNITTVQHPSSSSQEGGGPQQLTAPPPSPPVSSSPCSSPGSNSSNEDGGAIQMGTASTTSSNRTTTSAAASLIESAHLYLPDTMLNVFKFLEKLLSSSLHVTEAMCRHFVSAGGLKCLIDCLTMPGLPFDFALTPASTSLCKIFDVLTNSATSFANIVEPLFKILETSLDNLEPLMKASQSDMSILLSQHLNQSHQLLHEIVMVTSVTCILCQITEHFSQAQRRNYAARWAQSRLMPRLIKLFSTVSWQISIMFKLLFRDRDAIVTTLPSLGLTTVNNNESEFGLPGFVKNLPLYTIFKDLYESSLSTTTDPPRGVAPKSLDKLIVICARLLLSINDLVRAWSQFFVHPSRRRPRQRLTASSNLIPIGPCAIKHQVFSQLISGINESLLPQQPTSDDQASGSYIVSLAVKAASLRFIQRLLPDPTRCGLDYTLASLFYANSLDAFVDSFKQLVNTIESQPNRQQVLSTILHEWLSCALELAHSLRPVPLDPNTGSTSSLPTRDKIPKWLNTAYESRFREAMLYPLDQLCSNERLQNLFTTNSVSSFFVLLQILIPDLYNPKPRASPEPDDQSKQPLPSEVAEETPLNRPRTNFDPSRRVFRFPPNFRSQARAALSSAGIGPFEALRRRLPPPSSSSGTRDVSADRTVGLIDNEDYDEQAAEIMAVLGLTPPDGAASAQTTITVSNVPPPPLVESTPSQSTTTPSSQSIPTTTSTLDTPPPPLVTTTTDVTTTTTSNTSDIQPMLDMGFEPDLCRIALEHSNGNIQAAVNLVLTSDPDDLRSLQQQRPSTVNPSTIVSTTSSSLAAAMDSSSSSSSNEDDESSAVILPLSFFSSSRPDSPSNPAPPAPAPHPSTSTESLSSSSYGGLGIATSSSSSKPPPTRSNTDWSPESTKDALLLWHQSPNCEAMPESTYEQLKDSLKQNLVNTCCAIIRRLNCNTYLHHLAELLIAAGQDDQFIGRLVVSLVEAFPNLVDWTRLHLLNLMFTRRQYTCMAMIDQHGLVDKLIECLEGRLELLASCQATKDDDCCKIVTLASLLLDQYERVTRGIQITRRAHQLYRASHDWYSLDDTSSSWQLITPDGNNKSIDMAYHRRYVSLTYSSSTNRRNYLVDFSTMTRVDCDRPLRCAIMLMPNMDDSLKSVPHDGDDVELEKIETTSAAWEKQLFSQSKQPESLTSRQKQSILTCIVKLFGTQVSLPAKTPPDSPNRMSRTCMDGLLRLTLRLLTSSSHHASIDTFSSNLFNNLLILPHPADFTPQLSSLVGLLLFQAFEDPATVRRVMSDIFQKLAIAGLPTSFFGHQNGNRDLFYVLGYVAHLFAKDWDAAANAAGNSFRLTFTDDDVKAGTLPKSYTIEQPENRSTDFSDITLQPNHKKLLNTLVERIMFPDDSELEDAYEAMELEPSTNDPTNLQPVDHRDYSRKQQPIPLPNTSTNVPASSNTSSPPPKIRHALPKPALLNYLVQLVGSYKSVAHYLIAYRHRISPSCQHVSSSDGLSSDFLLHQQQHPTCCQSFLTHLFNVQLFDSHSSNSVILLLKSLLLVDSSSSSQGTILDEFKSALLRAVTTVGSSNFNNRLIQLLKWLDSLLLLPVAWVKRFTRIVYKCRLPALLAKLIALVDNQSPNGPDAFKSLVTALERLTSVDRQLVKKRPRKGKHSKATTGKSNVKSHHQHNASIEASEEDEEDYDDDYDDDDDDEEEEDDVAMEMEVVSGPSNNQQEANNRDQQVPVNNERADIDFEVDDDDNDDEDDDDEEMDEDDHAEVDEEDDDEDEDLFDDDDDQDDEDEDIVVNEDDTIIFTGGQRADRVGLGIQRDEEEDDDEDDEDDDESVDSGDDTRRPRAGNWIAAAASNNNTGGDTLASFLQQAFNNSSSVPTISISTTGGNTIHATLATGNHHHPRLDLDNIGLFFPRLAGGDHAINRRRIARGARLVASNFSNLLHGNNQPSSNNIFVGSVSVGGGNSTLIDHSNQVGFGGSITSTTASSSQSELASRHPFLNYQQSVNSRSNNQPNSVAGRPLPVHTSTYFPSSNPTVLSTASVAFNDNGPSNLLIRSGRGGQLDSRQSIFAPARIDYSSINAFHGGGGSSSFVDHRSYANVASLESATTGDSNRHHHHPAREGGDDLDADNSVWDMLTQFADDQAQFVNVPLASLMLRNMDCSDLIRYNLPPSFRRWITLSRLLFGWELTDMAFICRHEIGTALVKARDTAFNKRLEEEARKQQASELESSTITSAHVGPVTEQGHDDVEPMSVDNVDESIPSNQPEASSNQPDDRCQASDGGVDTNSTPSLLEQSDINAPSNANTDVEGSQPPPTLNNAETDTLLSDIVDIVAPVLESAASGQTPSSTASTDAVAGSLTTDTITAGTDSSVNAPPTTTSQPHRSNAPLTDEETVASLIEGGMDPSFLDALPDEVRREIINDHRRARQVEHQLGSVQLPEHVSADWLRQLPPHIQEEVLAQFRNEQRQEQLRQEQQQAAARASSQPAADAPTTTAPTDSQPSDRVTRLAAETNANSAALSRPAATTASDDFNLAFWDSLAPSVLREVLSDMDESQISLLPPNLAEIARQYHQENEARAVRASRTTFGSSRNPIRHLNSMFGNDNRPMLRFSSINQLLNSISQGTNPSNFPYQQASSSTATILDNGTVATGSSSNSRPQTLRTLIDTDGLVCLLALLVVTSVQTEQRWAFLPKIIQTLINLAANSRTRQWLTSTILSLLEGLSDYDLTSDSSSLSIATATTPASSTTPAVTVTNTSSLLHSGFEAALGCWVRIFHPLVGADPTVTKQHSIHPQAGELVSSGLLEVLSRLASAIPPTFYPPAPDPSKTDSQTGKPSMNHFTDGNSFWSTFDRLCRATGSGPVSNSSNAWLRSSRSGKRRLKRLTSQSSQSSTTKLRAQSTCEDANQPMDVSFEEAKSGDVGTASQVGDAIDNFNRLANLLCHPVIKKNPYNQERFLSILSSVLKKYIQDQNKSLGVDSSSRQPVSSTISESTTSTGVDSDQQSSSAAPATSTLSQKPNQVLIMVSPPDQFIEALVDVIVALPATCSAPSLNNVSASTAATASSSNTTFATTSASSLESARALASDLTTDLAFTNSDVKVKLLHQMACKAGELARRLIEQIEAVLTELQDKPVKNPASSSGQQRDSSSGTSLTGPTTSNNMHRDVSVSNTEEDDDGDEEEEDLHISAQFPRRQSTAIAFSTDLASLQTLCASSSNSLQRTLRNLFGLMLRVSVNDSSVNASLLSAPSSDVFACIDNLTQLWHLASQLLHEVNSKCRANELLGLQPLLEAYCLAHVYYAGDALVIRQPRRQIRHMTGHSSIRHVMIPSTASVPSMITANDSIAPTLQLRVSGSSTAASSSSNQVTASTAAATPADVVSHLSVDMTGPISPLVPGEVDTHPTHHASDRSTNPVLAFAESHRPIINQVIRSHPDNLGESPYALFLAFPRVLDFDIKRKFFRQQLHAINRASSQSSSRFNEEVLSISRNRLFEDSYARLHRKPAANWKHRFVIRFQNEEAQDAGGPLREWYLLMSREIFNPNYCLFRVSPSDRVTYTINASSYINSNHLSYFTFVGRFIAKAIHNNKLLECYFSRSFYKHILGVPLCYRDLESDDYEFFKGLEYLLTNNVSDLGYDLTFSTEISEFGQTETRDLIENGRNISVTDENKREYIRLVCQERMTGSIRQQLDAFLRGFYEIIPKRLISMFNEQELELLISGLPTIDIADLKANTHYSKYTESSPQIQWFWKALEAMDREDRARFLQFVTGTSKVPLGGFANLEGIHGHTIFQISRASVSSLSHLPCAHTCFNTLTLPAYESYEQLRDRLLTAIRECAEGFGMA